MPGIDIKSDGGYLVGPGSSINGKEYFCVDEQPLADLPSWWITNANSSYISTTTTRINGTRQTGQISVSPGNWHFPVLREVAKLVSRGFSDSDILCKMDQYTLSGYSPEQTRREVVMMIYGARKKGFDKKNEH